MEKVLRHQSPCGRSRAVEAKGPFIEAPESPEHRPVDMFASAR